jgi:hypothetical protein
MALDTSSRIAVGAIAATVISGFLPLIFPHLTVWAWAPLVTLSMLVLLWSLLPVLPWRSITKGTHSLPNPPLPAPLLRAADGSIINAENAEIASSVSNLFPGGLVNASGNSLVHMPGVKFVDAGGGTYRVQLPNSDLDFEALPEAGRRVLEANLENLIGEMAMSEPTPTERLNWMGIWIAEIHGIPLYGKRPPSQRYELIPRERLSRFQFADGASMLKESFGSNPVYTELAVRWGDIGANWEVLTSPR